MRMNRELYKRNLHRHYTYEYRGRLGGYVYHADRTLAKQNKVVPIRQQVRERNRKTPSSSQPAEEEKHGESEPRTFNFTNNEGVVQIMALTRRNRFCRHEGKLLVPVPKSGQQNPESDFHKAAVRDSSGKSGPNPVGFSKWGNYAGWIRLRLL